MGDLIQFFPTVWVKPVRLERPLWLQGPVHCQDTSRGALAVGLGYPLQEPCPVSSQLGAGSHPDAFKNVGVGSSELGAAELLYSLKENYPSLEDLL